MATAMRPQGFAGSPLPLCSSSSCQVRPPSVVLKKPLPLGDVGLSPPDRKVQPFRRKSHMPAKRTFGSPRSEEHTSELQSRLHLVCRLLLEKKKDTQDKLRDTFTSTHAGYVD